MIHKSIKYFVATSLTLSLAMLTVPAYAQNGNDRSVSDGGRAPSSVTESMPGPSAGAIPAGQPFVGSDVVTSEDLTALGAVLEPETTAPDPLHPDLLNMMEAAPESIVGWDSRMRHYTTTYPNRAIVYLQYNSAHLCTGFMVSRDTLVTSGHCLHTGGSSGQWRDRRLMRVFAGRDGSSSPYASCGVTRMHSVKGWTQSRLPEYDYGAMRLDCSIGDTVGWFGTYTPSNSELRNTPVTIAGYPGDKPQTQWSSSDKVRERNARLLCYRADTIGGNSGGPAFHDRSEALSTTGTWAIGVHGYGVGLPACGGVDGQMNGAVRMHGSVVRNITRWINRS